MKIKATGPKPARTQSTIVPSGLSQAQADSSSASSAESSSEDGSEDETSADESNDMDQKPPLPAVRPTEPEKAIEYDVTKVVWSRYDKHITGADIRTALGAYWTLIKPIRDEWKTEITAMQEAEAKDQQAKVEYHKSRSLVQRRMLEHAIRATVDHGHTEIVEKYVLPVSPPTQRCISSCSVMSFQPACNMRPA